jgi:hypothetical protein
MAGLNPLESRRRAWLACALATVAVVGAATLIGQAQAGAGGQASFPTTADIEAYRNTVERLFMTDRGGTTGGRAACVMCHTWQTRPMRFSLETPATDAGWTVEQSRRNFEIVTKLVNTKEPEASRLLLKPLSGGIGHTGGTYWRSREDPEYQTLLKWIRSLPADRYVPAREPFIDFAFFRACVQPVFANPREGHIACSNCHQGGQAGFAPSPQNGKTWSDEEAKRAFSTIARLIIPGNPEQSRFLLKPLHPDGGGTYTHNGPRRWQSKSDPEWQMIAGWARGDRKGESCQ